MYIGKIKKGELQVNRWISKFFFFWYLWHIQSGWERKNCENPFFLFAFCYILGNIFIWIIIIFSFFRVPWKRKIIERRRPLCLHVLLQVWLRKRNLLILFLFPRIFLRQFLSTNMPVYILVFFRSFATRQKRLLFLLSSPFEWASSIIILLVKAGSYIIASKK